MFGTTDWEIESLKSLLALCEERGIVTPFTYKEVDACVQELQAEGTTLLEVVRFLNRCHAVIHELLYVSLQK